MTMERLQLSQQSIDTYRAMISSAEIGCDKPCPGSNLKLDDDVQWLGFVYARILWGHPSPLSFYVYAPDIFGEGYALLDVAYVWDRAPADPNEAPLPIYPQTQFAQQPGAREAAEKKTKHNPTKHEAEEAIKKVMHSLTTKEGRHKFRAYVRQHRPDLSVPEET